MRGVTSSQVRAIAFEVISTHTPHARRDIKDEISKFLGVISTHTPHARRDRVDLDWSLKYSISTHTPHARRDDENHHSTANTYISTHTPHARRDIAKQCTDHIVKLFQLTRLMRGVTYKQLCYIG